MTKQFAEFRFDADEGTLWRGAQQIPLTGKAASLLWCLLERAGSWLSKSAIMAAVWPDTHVQPDNVKVLVREIRQALGDTSRDSRFIKSAPGRGYSFIADVSQPAVSGGARPRASKPQSSSIAGPRWRRWPMRSMPSARLPAARF